MSRHRAGAGAGAGAGAHDEADPLRTMFNTPIVPGSVVVGHGGAGGVGAPTQVLGDLVNTVDALAHAATLEDEKVPSPPPPTRPLSQLMLHSPSFRHSSHSTAEFAEEAWGGSKQVANEWWDGREREADDEDDEDNEDDEEDEDEDGEDEDEDEDLDVEEFVHVPQWWTVNRMVQMWLNKHWAPMASVWKMLVQDSITTRLDSLEESNLMLGRLRATQELAELPVLSALGTTLLTPLEVQQLTQSASLRAKSTMQSARPGDGIIVKLRLAVREMARLDAEGALIHDALWRRTVARRVHATLLRAMKEGLARK